MSIASEVTMTVGFICVRRHGILKPVGTVFFVCHAEKQQSKIYAITAKHVIDGVVQKLAATSVVITYNGVKGREEREIPVGDWVFHPNPGSDYIDVAVTPFSYDFSVDGPHAVNPHRIRYWMDHSLYGHRNELTPHFHISKLQIAEQVLIAGLFVHYSGITENIPIVRTGNLAAIPSEPVKTSLGSMTALLVEIRSIGGLSGSPVIGRLTTGNPSIIGLVHGHFDQSGTDSIEMGIARVKQRKSTLESR